MAEPKRVPRPHVVRFSGQLYFCGLESDGVPIGSPFSSVALRFTYATGAEICAALHELGFDDAIVTNIYGFPVLPQEAGDGDMRQSEDFRQAWRPAEAAKQ